MGRRELKAILITEPETRKPRKAAAEDARARPAVGPSQRAKGGASELQPPSVSSSEAAFVIVNDDAFWRARG